MYVSHMIHMPELSALKIPPRQCRIALKDEVIFADVRNAHRRLEKQEGPAAPGDYVLAKAVPARGPERNIHIELGSNSFPAYEAALLGARAGERRQAVIYGEETVLQVQSVRKVVELPLTDANIAALGLPDIKTLVDYRRQYIRTHGKEQAERIFQALQGGLLQALAQQMEVFLDETEVKQFHRQQRDMIQRISGDVDQRLMDAYGGRTPEEADRLFFADNRQTFQIYVWGRELARQNGRQMTAAERQQMLGNYMLMHETTEAAIQAQGLQEAVEQPFYIQYGIGRLKQYYLSLVRFSAAGIPSQAL